MSSIAKNLAAVRERIKGAAEKCGRDPKSIKLVAVSKTKAAAEIKEAFNAGQTVFGENYAQELRDKAKELGDLAIKWHFIGHLQKNKVKYVAPVSDFIETIDDIDLARAIDERAGHKIRCLIEVNIGDEDSKSGVAEGDVAPLAKELQNFPNLELKGLMVIPPFSSNPEKSRPYFKKLKILLTKLNSELAGIAPLTELSMGMSHDFEVAIEEGATIIRVGTAIFGERV